MVLGSTLGLAYSYLERKQLRKCETAALRHVTSKFCMNAVKMCLADLVITSETAMAWMYDSCGTWKKRWGSIDSFSTRRMPLTTS